MLGDQGIATAILDRLLHLYFAIVLSASPSPVLYFYSATNIIAVKLSIWMEKGIESKIEKQYLINESAQN